MKTTATTTTTTEMKDDGRAKKTRGIERLGEHRGIDGIYCGAIWRVFFRQLIEMKPTGMDAFIALSWEDKKCLSSSSENMVAALLTRTAKPNQNIGGACC